MECRICGNKDSNKSILVKEMMFGLKEFFEYFECNTCGCLQIKDLPENIAKYYPKEYYSFNSKIKESKGLNRLLESYLLKSFILNKKPNGFLFKIYKNYAFLHGIISHNSKILDVGCGSGNLLHRLQNSGFNCLGIDPFIENTIQYKNGLKILKTDLSCIKDKFDVIILHHSLEHMFEQQNIINQIKNLLEKDGCFILSLPLADSFAYKHYKENYYGIDAPRHLYLHTIKSIMCMLEKVGLEIKNIEYDGYFAQFVASEQYQQNITLYDERSYFVNSQKSNFTKKQIETFSLKAEKLNKEHEGDQATFYIGFKND